jgi:hypothetical protein
MENESQTATAGCPAPTTPPQSEVTTEQLEKLVGGFLAFTFKLVAVKTVSWAHD